jgi:hypothetical protein
VHHSVSPECTPSPQSRPGRAPASRRVRHLAILCGDRLRCWRRGGLGSSVVVVSIQSPVVRWRDHPRMRTALSISLSLHLQHSLIHPPTFRIADLPRMPVRARIGTLIRRCDRLGTYFVRHKARDRILRTRGTANTTASPDAGAAATAHNDMGTGTGGSIDARSIVRLQGAPTPINAPSDWCSLPLRRRNVPVSVRQMSRHS